MTWFVINAHLCSQHIVQLLICAKHFLLCVTMPLRAGSGDETTCDLHVEVSIKKQCNMILKFIYMKQCHGFLHSWQDMEPVPCTDFLKVKSLDITYFKTAWDNKLVSHQ